jgi:hypothetical protein
MKPAFPRVVWAKAPHAPVFATAHLSVQLVAETFGPPDVRGTVATWSFADESRMVRCAIVARVSNNYKSTKPMQMDFIGPAKTGRPFFDWATAKINLTANGQLPPAFLVAEH